MNESASRLEQIVSRAQMLYSRPTVAMEVVRLAEQPRVDPQAIKKCVEQDPALTCKVLRVVNSSLYGLNRPVADLNQAIGLLGIKPLKLLVLGFSLPDALFAEVAARELQWYWTNTLTRAVAARLLSEQLWHQAGDEAFIAGLLQDIGILVLLRELGEPYVKFLSGAIEEKCTLAALEQDTLGFDHSQLSAALLAHWQLPQRLVDAIATPKRQARLSRMSPPEGDLAANPAPGRAADAARRPAAVQPAARIVGGRKSVSRHDQAKAGGARGRLAAASRSAGRGACRSSWRKSATTCKCCWPRIKQWPR